MQKSKIEWTDSVWNPVRGCSIVSAGCTNCYAMHTANRFKGPGQPYEDLIMSTSQGPKWNGKIRLVHNALTLPLHQKKPHRIFVNSMSDLFHDAVPDDFINRVFAVMALCPQHTFQILTKRPQRMLDYMTKATRPRGLGVWICDAIQEISTAQKITCVDEYKAKLRVSIKDGMQWELPNVWLGVSVENQATADQRIPLLLETPAAVRWLSMEPLLGPVDLGKFLWECCETPTAGAEYMGQQEQVCCGNKRIVDDGIHWVVCGGESGPNARPMHPKWVRDIRYQCAETSTPFFFKQWGEFTVFDPDMHSDAPDSRLFWSDGQKRQYGDGQRGVELMVKVGKSNTGRLLDGIEHNEYPKVDK